MWQPDPGWQELPSGAGQCTVGVWRAAHRSGPAVVKRLRRPGPEEPSLWDPRHPAYWRREAEVAQEPGLVAAPGVRTPSWLRVDEDDEGITLWTAELPHDPPTELFVARALGAFCASPAPAIAWAARDLLPVRLESVAARGGWPLLARTDLAGVAEELWQDRQHWLERHLAGPPGRVHGDAAAGNFPASIGTEVVAVDWQSFGIGPIGLDLGCYALSARVDFEVLLASFLEGVRTVRPGIEAAQVATTARVISAYTALTRAEWALSRVAAGEGSWDDKLRHPSITRHLRAVRRAWPQIGRLLGS